MDVLRADESEYPMISLKSALGLSWGFTNTESKIINCPRPLGRCWWHCAASQRCLLSLGDADSLSMPASPTCFSSHHSLTRDTFLACLYTAHSDSPTACPGCPRHGCSTPSTTSFTQKTAICVAPPTDSDLLMISAGGSPGSSTSIPSLCP